MLISSLLTALFLGQAVQAFSGTDKEALERCKLPQCIKAHEYSAMLGRAGWTLLHSITVNYPDHPTEEQKADAYMFLHVLSKLYPCKMCAENFKKELVMLPPRLGSRTEFATWLCELHNSVNVRLGKPVFDCSQVFERWMRDPADGFCPETCPVNFDDEEAEVDLPPMLHH
jgi:FAD-linked sulfhydryl oxidase